MSSATEKMNGRSGSGVIRGLREGLLLIVNRLVRWWCLSKDGEWLVMQVPGTPGHHATPWNHDGPAPPRGRMGFGDWRWEGRGEGTRNEVGRTIRGHQRLWTFLQAFRMSLQYPECGGRTCNACFQRLSVAVVSGMDHTGRSGREEAARPAGGRRWGVEMGFEMGYEMRCGEQREDLTSCTC